MIKILNEQEIKEMRRSAKVLNGLLTTLYQAIKPGVTGLMLDRLALKYLQNHDAQSNFFQYHGFPNQICVSVNSDLIHGIPNNTAFQAGDIVSVDAGCTRNGLHTDAAFTKIVQAPKSTTDLELVQVTKVALQKAVSIVKAGIRIGTISSIIQRTVEAQGFHLNTMYAGHGIGHELHQDPVIPNQGDPNTGPRLAAGTVVCLEPMVQIGSPEVIIADDKWTVQTANDCNSAHYEAMVLVTATGHELLTKIF